MATLLRCWIKVSARNRLSVWLPARHYTAGRCKVTSQMTTECHDKPAVNWSLSFADPHDVFKHKTTWEICRALLVLKMCSYNIVVNNCDKCLSMGDRLLGRRLFTAVVRPLFYKQFVAGDNREDIQDCVTGLHKAGIGLLISVPLEEDVTASAKEEMHYDSNLQGTLKAINIASEMQKTHPMIHFRLTGLIPACLCVTMSKLCPEPSQNPEVVRSVAVAMETGDSVQLFPSLSEIERSQLTSGLKRLKAIGRLAVERNVIIMVDAELTSVNPVLNLFSLAMMMNYNKDVAVVFYTYQNYLKSTPQRLRRDVQFISECGVCFGAKLVRGAYMIRERCEAKKQGHPDPLHDTFDDTTSAYNHSMELMLSRISESPEKTRIIIASHNQQTVERALERIKWYRINPKSGSVFFGQVMGIGDHITFQLGACGWPIHKAVPVASMLDSLAYLSRRVQESRAILDGTSQERDLLKTALKGRLLGVGSAM